MMASPKISSQDKKDLSKFTKFFVYKCIQVIVQSRLGEKAYTKSKAVSSGSDWFNLALKDIPEVLTEIKNVLSESSLDAGQEVCVEISLKTQEGDTMVLETWNIAMNQQQDSSKRISYTVYNRMGILLKSLICCTRVTPAYRLSRKQSTDAYVICYRIYTGEAQLKHLGEGYQRTKVGEVPTALGNIGLMVMYRTKMLISPQPCCKDFDVKDDHFRVDFSPRQSKQSPRPCRHPGSDIRHSSSEEAMAITSSESECCDTTFSTSPPDNSPGYFIPSRTGSSFRDRHRNSSGDNLNRLPDPCGPKTAAFAPYRDSDPKELDEDIPFASLLQPDDKFPGCSCDSKSSSHDSHDGGENMENASRSSESASSGRAVGHKQDDFVMVELRTPFADADANSELGNFYRECQDVNSKSMFEENTTVEEGINFVTNQLAMFEADSKSIAAFISNLDNTE